MKDKRYNIIKILVLTIILISGTLLIALNQNDSYNVSEDKTTLFYNTSDLLIKSGFTYAPLAINLGIVLICLGVYEYVRSKSLTKIVIYALVFVIDLLLFIAGFKISNLTDAYMWRLLFSIFLVNVLVFDFYDILTILRLYFDSFDEE